MLLRVDNFINWVEHDLNGLIDDLRVVTGRYGEWETRAWQRSLPELSKILGASELGGFHLHLGQSGGMALEYRLPASSSWADVVLLGASADQPAAVVIELKDWDTTGDQPGPRPGLIEHKGGLMLHPSDQVRGYVEYCRRFHSAVLDHQAVVEGCVFFTSRADIDPYIAPPHEDLTAAYPVFSQADLAGGTRLPEYLARQLVYPNEPFARAFEEGYYKQDRDFVRQIADTIRSGDEPVFVLLDEQRRGFEVCMGVIERVGHTGEKAVVIVEGPPGSGKSVLAANLWAAMAGDETIDGSIVFATTSSSQRTNWMRLFDLAARGRGGHGVVIPANKYNPGLSPTWVKQERGRGLAIEIDDWRENLRHFHATGGKSWMADDQLAVSIVDEAHALPGAAG